MDPTIFISTPPAGGTVGPAFGAAGAVTPTGSAVSVKFSNSDYSYGPFNATVTGGEWDYHFSGIHAGTGYTLTASIIDFGGVSDSHSGITVT